MIRASRFSAEILAGFWLGFKVCVFLKRKICLLGVIVEAGVCKLIICEFCVVCW